MRQLLILQSKSGGGERGERKEQREQKEDFSQCNSPIHVQSDSSHLSSTTQPCSGGLTLRQAVSYNMACRRDLCLAQPSSEKLPPAANGNRYRDPQPDNVQNEQPWNTHLIEMSPSNPSPQGTLGEKREEKVLYHFLTDVANNQLPVLKYYEVTGINQGRHTGITGSTASVVLVLPNVAYFCVVALVRLAVKYALLTDKVKVKEQLVEAEQSLEKIQEQEVRKSVSATDTQSEDEEESQFKTKAQKVKVKEFSFSSSSESDLEEEESCTD
ncbi:hypothetical protein STEG23_023116 [Scotinomys teguina]